MLLTLDVGNTNITIGVFDEDKLLFVSRMASDLSRMEDQYAIEILDIIKLHQIKPKNIDGAIICSVVPKLTKYIQKAIKLIFNLKAFVVNKDLIVNLQAKDAPLDSLGADIIVGCVAAKELYSCPNIVIDMGTATTIFVTDKDGFVLGGSILPGVGISLDALTNRAAQLSAIGLEAPQNVIGRDTESCIQSGVIFGAASMIDGLCERIETELGYTCKKVATGGLARTIVENCRSEVVFRDTLILDGLKIIYNSNKK